MSPGRPWLFRIRRRLGRFRDRLLLKRTIARTRPLRILIGASGTAEPGWISTDVDRLNLLSEADWRYLVRENAVDALLAEHVWEHLSPEEGLIAARNCYRFLKPGGYLRAAVPDGFHPDAQYLLHVRPGGTGPGASDHKVLYTIETFSRLFESAGFRIEPLEYFDSQGAFHELPWDPAEGKVRRSRRFDERNRDGVLRYTSIIIDARKPQP